MNEHIQVRPFLFESEGMVRVLERDGAPWFLAADPCRIIGIRDVSDAVEKLDDDEKGRASIPTLGGTQEVLIISEGGLYTIILRSRDATKQGTIAHRFRKWVTGEVLPALRTTGSYRMGEGIEEDFEAQTPDGLKLRKVNTAIRAFGERAGAELWFQLGLEVTPSMRNFFKARPSLFDEAETGEGAAPPSNPPGTVTVTVTPAPQNGSAH